MCEYEEIRKYIPNIDNFEKTLRMHCSPILWLRFADLISTEFGNGTFVKIDEHFGVLNPAHVCDIFLRQPRIISVFQTEIPN